MNKNAALDSIKGRKVRRQHFSYIIACICLFVMPMLIISTLLGLYGEIPLSKLYDIYLYTGIIVGPVLLFLSALWLHVHFHAGAIVCVLNDDGIHYANDWIAWSEIQKITYHIRIPERCSAKSSENPDCCKAVISTEHGEISLDHAPYFLIMYVKKKHPKIKARLSKLGRGYLAFCLLCPVVFILAVLLAPLFS